MNKVLLTHSHNHSFTSSSGGFPAVAVTEMVWFWQPKIFTILQKKFAVPCRGPWSPLGERGYGWNSRDTHFLPEGNPRHFHPHSTGPTAPQGLLGNAATGLKAPTGSVPAPRTRKCIWSHSSSSCFWSLLPRRKELSLRSEPSE